MNGFPETDEKPAFGGVCALRKKRDFPGNFRLFSGHLVGGGHPLSGFHRCCDENTTPETLESSQRVASGSTMVETVK